MGPDHGATAAPSTPWASRLVVLFGLVVAANWVVAVARGVAATGVDLSLAVLLLMVTGVLGYGLNRRARWARILSLILAAVGLFFVAPIVGTMLLGGGLQPVGTGWDVVFFPLVTLILIALLVVLASAWSETPPRS